MLSVMEMMGSIDNTDYSEEDVEDLLQDVKPEEKMANKSRRTQYVNRYSPEDNDELLEDDYSEEEHGIDTTEHHPGMRQLTIPSLLDRYEVRSTATTNPQNRRAGPAPAPDRSTSSQAPFRSQARSVNVASSARLEVIDLTGSDEPVSRVEVNQHVHELIDLILDTSSEESSEYEYDASSDGEDNGRSLFTSYDVQGGKAPFSKSK